MKYQRDLRELGFHINIQLLNRDNLCAIMCEEGSQPISPLYDLKEVFNDNNYIQNCLDIQRSIDVFIPDDTLQNEMVVDTKSRVEHIFTPEISQDTQNNVDQWGYTLNNFHSAVYDNVNEFSYQDNLSERLDFKNLSNSENIHKLYPEK